MKIVFKELKNIDGVIQVSFDGGQSWTQYSILNIKEDGGIPLPDEQDLSLIKIKSDNTVLSKMEVISSIGAETIVDVSNIESVNVIKQNFNKKKLNYRASIFDVMFAMQAWNLIWENSCSIIYSRDILNNLYIFEGQYDDIVAWQNILKSNIKSFCIAGVSSDQESFINYGHTFSNAITGEKINQDNVEIIYETLEHYEEALKNNDVIKVFKSTRDDLEDIASPYDLLDGTSVEYPHMIYRDGKHYNVRYIKQNDDINVELIECAFEIDKQFLIFFDDIITGIKRTVHPELNLNAATINFKSTTDFEEMRLDDINKFINKYDSENDIFYSLIATTNNENVPEELRYGMIVYINYSAPDGLPDRDVPYDVWYSENDNNEIETYSFNFEFNDNIDDYMSYISNAGDGMWTTNEEGENVCYALTSADKKGYKFTKESDGTINYTPFDFSTTKEYIAAASFVKKDSYSLYKKFVDKVPQIKIEDQDPQGESLILLDSDGKPSFITIQELKTKLGIS